MVYREHYRRMPSALSFAVRLDVSRAVGVSVGLAVVLVPWNAMANAVGCHDMQWYAMGAVAALP